MTKKRSYKEIITENIIRIENISDINIGPYEWLAQSIQANKEKIRIETIDYIIVKILNRNKMISTLRRKSSFDVFVIGSFRKYFSATEKVANLFSEFYLEMGVLPNIIVIPKSIFIKYTNNYINKIKNGVLIYERR